MTAWLSKQLVSDAIRNAAMRFGVALDLWAKEDLHAIQNPPTPEPLISPEVAERFRAALNDAGKAERDAWLTRFRVKPQDLPLALLAEARTFIDELTATATAEAES